MNNNSRKAIFTGADYFFSHDPEAQQRISNEYYDLDCEIRARADGHLNLINTETENGFRIDDEADVLRIHNDTAELVIKKWAAGKSEREIRQLYGFSSYLHVSAEERSDKLTSTITSMINKALFPKDVTFAERNDKTFLENNRPERLGPFSRMFNALYLKKMADEAAYTEIGFRNLKSQDNRVVRIAIANSALLAGVLGTDAALIQAHQLAATTFSIFLAAMQAKRVVETVSTVRMEGRKTHWMRNTPAANFLVSF